MFWIFMFCLWIAMAIAPWGLLVALLPSGRDCPCCDGETVLLRNKVLRPARRFIGRRWCTACGWEGYMRFRTPKPAPIFGPPTGHEGGEDGEGWERNYVYKPGL